jgi:hypothetical protein
VDGDCFSLNVMMDEVGCKDNLHVPSSICGMYVSIYADTG